MAAVEIIDIEVALAEPKKVKLAGKVWTVPGQIPIPIYLRFRQLARGAAENPDAAMDDVEVLHAEVLALFQVHHPDLEAFPGDLPQLLAFIKKTYGASDEPGEAQKTRGRTGSKKPVPKTRSARSRS
jgi:hypothetical protein